MARKAMGQKPAKRPLGAVISYLVLLPDDEKARLASSSLLMAKILSGIPSPQEYIEYLKTDYESSGNAWFAWLAFDVCNQAAVPAPDWVRNYLAICARRLLKIANLDQVENVDRAIVEAFDLKRGQGQSRIFDEYDEYMRAMLVIEDYIAARTLNPKSKKHAVGVAAKQYDVTDDQVRHVLRKFGIP